MALDLTAFWLLVHLGRKTSPLARLPLDVARGVVLAQSVALGHGVALARNAAPAHSVAPARSAAAAHNDAVAAMAQSDRERNLPGYSTLMDAAGSSHAWTHFPGQSQHSDGTLLESAGHPERIRHIQPARNGPYGPFAA